MDIERRISALTLILVLLAACDRRAETPAAPAQQAAAPASASELQPGLARTFGGSHFGFVDFLERDGRFAVMHRFLEDTNGDGVVEPRFGDHGEPEGDLPAVTVVDFRTGAETNYDELLATDSRGELVVVRRGADVLVVRASGVTKLPDADPRADANPCMPARQASIDPGGKWLAYPRTDPDRAVVRDIESGAEREFATEGLLWRVDATPLGWGMVREVTDDTDGDSVKNWPRRQGSCICRWCSRFARSVGAGKLAGDTFTSTLLHPDGRRLTSFDQPLPITPQHVWSLTQHRLYDLEGAVVPLGPGESCRLVAVPLETGKLVTRCGAEHFVWDPSTTNSQKIAERVEALELFAPAQDGWIGVRVDDGAGAGAKKVGRLNVRDARVEHGPSALRVGPVHPSGWLLVADAANVSAFHIATGQTTPIGDKGGRLLPLAFQRGDAWHVVDPATGRTAASPEPPEFIASNGCYIAPYDKRRPVRGPFELRCGTGQAVVPQ